jgi:beta-xylosidase
VDTAEKARVELKGKRVFLRIDGDFRPGQDIATFYYSLDGKQWTPIGGTFQMRFDFTRLFMGTRYALFNYATKQTGGYVDINRFCYTKANK